MPAAQVRTAAELDAVDGLIMPGGESTSMANLMDTYGLRDPLKYFARSGRPVWGTCAGLILMASRLTDDRPIPLGLMDITVRRNGFGRQIASFETSLPIAGIEGGPVPAVFIRAPLICEAGPDVEVLAALNDEGCVAARQGNLLASAFHPELTDDLRMHQYFLDMLPGEDAG